MIELLAALEANPLAVALRNSVWAYPLVNAGHIAGIALLVGAIVPLDLRLLGCWPQQPLTPLWQVLGSMAAVGLVMAIAFGALLFAARATEYAGSGYFVTKMAVLGTGVVNALALRRYGARRNWPRDDARIPHRVRIFAGVSIAAWFSTLLLGRLVGYF